MSEDTSDGRWFEGLPRSGYIYQVIDRTKASERRETRIRALKALGGSDDPRAVLPLVECTRDEAAEIRRYATRGLYRLRSARGVEALHERLKERTEEWVTRKLAADALGEIRSHRATEVLIERLQDREEDVSIREYVALVLGRTRTETARYALRQCYRDAGPSLQRSIEDALGMFDAPPHPVNNKRCSMQIQQ
jgi:HEAT repeat protein